MTNSRLRKLLQEYERPYQRLQFVSGDLGAIATTKVGGTPWWPSNVDRPKCVDGHLMSFVMQIRVDEVPGFDQPPTLLSFHYCDSCTLEGKMPFGWTDQGHQLRYSVQLFSDLECVPDGLQVVAESRAPVAKVQRLDGSETLNLFDIWETFPATQSQDFEMDDSILGLNEECSKLGGWPSWYQNPEYPEDDDGSVMSFVGQLCGSESAKNAWGCGAVYLFVSEYDEDEPQQADMVIQTT
ncbi:DUF1963 domain-containing protein [Aeoliella mucimassa]|nr:DUF1963 domain-containing protein [Aeoliella mucimassa]